MHKGKPTWGALADSLPSPSPFTQTNVGIIGDGLKANSKSCYYWAVEKSCNNTAESCKYLHDYSPLGVAARPGFVKSSTWKREWRDHHNHEASENGAGDHSGDHAGDHAGDDLVLEEVEVQVDDTDDFELDGWGQRIPKSAQTTFGESTWGENRYRPPHIKALEEKFSREAAGW